MIACKALARRLAAAPREPWPDEPVRVTLAITDLDVGGAERALVALATGLDRRRWRPSVVALGGRGGAGGGRSGRRGSRVECLGVNPAAPISGRPRRWPGRSAGRRPALVQSFLFHANIAARLAAPMAGAPWVVGGLRVAERQRRWHLASGPAHVKRLATGSACVSEGVRRFSVESGRLDPAASS